MRRSSELSTTWRNRCPTRGDEGHNDVLLHDECNPHCSADGRRSPQKQLWFGLMPTVLRSGPYRVYFYSHEPNEPPHVHVDRDQRTAKFWLTPVALARNLGFTARELKQLESLIEENRQKLFEAWNEHFGS
jgi:hypothetical protein